MAIKFEPLSAADQAKALVEKAGPTLIEALRGLLAKPKHTRAPNGTFDRKAYQRELMRKRRAEGKA